jgi:hypothetical protein
MYSQIPSRPTARIPPRATEGTLDLNFRGSYEAIEPLQGMFATAILKLQELPPDPKDGRVYDLNPLQQRSFEFVYPEGSGIQRGDDHAHQLRRD